MRYLLITELKKISKNKNAFQFYDLLNYKIEKEFLVLV